MTFRKNILIIVTLFILSCQGKQESKLNTETSSGAKTEIKAKLKTDKDLSESAQLFALAILKENIRIHTFDVSNSDQPAFLKIFQVNGLEKITAYSNKEYPKKTEPNYYEHFTLFVATYESSLSAKNSFNQLKSDSKFGFTDLKELSGEIAERVKVLAIGAKPGGMITQNGKQVFSLVKTCRETPIGGNWIDYENKFIEFITESGEEIEVLNANCGMDRYIIEKRKASK